MSKFHSAGEDRNRNKRRARTCSYTGRPMATCAKARQWVEKRWAAYVCAYVYTWDARKNGADERVDDTWKCCSELHQLLRQRCGSSLFMSEEIFHASRWRRFSVDYARERYIVRAKIVRLSKVGRTAETRRALKPRVRVEEKDDL